MIKLIRNLRNCRTPAELYDFQRHRRCTSLAAFGYDRRVIVALSLNQSAGPMDGNDGLTERGPGPASKTSAKLGLNQSTQPRTESS
jgi:hypothetical protein